MAIWLPRGRGRDDRAVGLLCALRVCTNPDCACTEARVTALPVDDRLRWAKDHEGHITTKWRESHDPSESHPLTLDFVSGSVTDARGRELPAVLRPFFRDPIPAWLLDDIYADWAKSRPAPPSVDGALERWQPGDMLSVLDADPTRRPDTYVLGTGKYVVDLCFCVAPDCACTANRFVVLAVEDTVGQTRWSEIGSIELGPGMTPREFEGGPEHRQTVHSLYLDWRARSGNPEARLAELRAVSRACGASLYELARARDRARPPLQIPARALAPPSPPIRTGAAAPGRNAPCPCGSGKKFKRCCASSSPLPM